MNIFTRIISFFTSNAIGQRKGIQDSTPTITVHEDTPSVGVDGALQVSTVWSCVTLLAETISSLPLMVYRHDGTSRVVASSAPIYSVMHDKPNMRHTSQEFWETMVLNLVLRGNAYARLKRNPKGEVVSLWPLSADQMEVIVADDSSLIYAYSINDKTIGYLENEIMHIHGIGNGVIGLSPLDYMRSSVGLAISAQNHTTKTFNKDARRPGILMSDQVLTKEQRAALKENFGDIVSGNGKELYILEAQFKFEPLGMSPADIQLLESRQFSVQDIARWFGVPSILINDTAESSALGSSTQQIIDGFYRLKIRPQLERIEQIIQMRVLTASQRGRGYTVEFNLDALLRASATDRMEIYAKAVQNGIKTRNECRKLENLEPKAGGDTLTAQVNLMPIDMLGQQNTDGGSVPPETVEQ